MAQAAAQRRKLIEARSIDCHAKLRFNIDAA